MTTRSSFFVYGTPAPQGSKRHLGNGVLVESSKRVAPWRADVRAAAQKWFPRPQSSPHPHPGYFHLTLEFRFPRPKSHYRTGRFSWALREQAPRADCHTQRPDVDKLARAVLDALTGVVWGDDSRVTHLTASKQWCEPGEEGVHITIEVRPL